MAIFGAVGAVAALVPGGAKSMGVSTDLLVHAPFDTFLIPGIFLLLVIFGGNFISGVLLSKKQNIGAYLSAFMGFITKIWIIAQWLLMAAVFPIQLIFMLISLLQFVLSVWLIQKHKLPFPFAAYQH
ncbi:hypothetical protein P3T75_13435 [Enterococcus montenegrensis]|uniref:hypothetical protein n=1 Tax=Enterococcus montenegrensis TaxID=3031993 RepID=UPI00249D9D3E|nr:hypothetical protein [Enterococcus montenegrensis]WHA09254.1 hypothetical protein P3T75_13435 [Enterococcus montenegrensis]